MGGEAKKSPEFASAALNFLAPSPYRVTTMNRLRPASGLVAGLFLGNGDNRASRLPVPAKISVLSIKRLI